MSDLPSGVPHVLYECPDMYPGYQDQALQVDDMILDGLITQHSTHITDCNESVEEWVLDVMLKNQWCLPIGMHDSIDLFENLRLAINDAAV